MSAQKKNLATFNELICKKIGQGDSKKTKRQLYLIETQLMSGKRPQRISAHPIILDGTTYYEVNSSEPVTPTRTVSSSKKNEAGIANWLTSTTTILSADFEELDKREMMRSASIVPHDIIKASNLCRDLAIDTTRRNVAEHLIPSLAKALLVKNPSQNDPLVLNYEMLTLLSPISPLVDKRAAFDPDFTQYQAIRNALSFYHGRTITVEIDGKQRQVQFNAIYQNYGVNPGRKLSTAADAANQKAYNDILDRSIEKMQEHMQAFKSDPNLFNFQSEIISILKHPSFTSDELVKLDILQEGLSGKGGLYEKMEANSAQFSPKEHERLLALSAKQIDKIPLTNAERKEFIKLSTKFLRIKQQNAVLKAQADDNLQGIYSIHAKRAEARVKNVLENYHVFERILPLLESSDDPAKKETAEHIRALYEYTKLIIAGPDSLAGTQNNKNLRNYEIQCYIERLNQFCEWRFHVTCKSGKDRTNAAIEKQKAKAMLSLHQGRLVQAESEDVTLKLEEKRLFVQGYQQGPGSDICGDNMKPGAQQVDSGDFSTDATAAISAGKKIATIQKGLNHLKVSKSVKTEILADYSSTWARPSLVNPPLPEIKVPIPPSIQTRARSHALSEHRRNLTPQAQQMNSSDLIEPVVSAPDTVFDLNKRFNKEPSERFKTKLVGFKELQITPQNSEARSFYAKSESNKLNYCAQVPSTDEELRAICEFAVKYTPIGTPFNLSQAPEAEKDKMQVMLKQEMEKTGKTGCYEIILTEPPRAASFPRQQA